MLRMAIASLIVAGALAGRTRAEWMAELEPAGIPCGPINTVAEALASPQTEARGMVTSLDHPSAGPIDLVGIPFKLFGTPPAVTSPPPRLGEHSEDVLAELGLDEERIDALVEAGVTTRGE